MFVVDKVVEEDRRLLHANELEPITLPDGTTQTLGPAARDAFAIFEDLCLLGNGERPQFLQLEYLHKTFALELIESVLTNYRDLFRKVRGISLVFVHASLTCTAFRALAPPAAPSLPATPQNTVRALHFPAHTSWHPRRFSPSQTIFFRALDGI